MSLLALSLFLLAKLLAMVHAGSSEETVGLKDYGNYKGKQNFKIDGVIPVTLHKSSKTGLSVVHAEVKKPVVDGYICLATEAHDDDGLPHTLEHLIFQGSKKYPYKGALDMIATRCLARRTNAWTGQLETCYDIKTAGSDGFLKLLPVFLDHILNPTLNDSSFVTEIYHITGEGRDGGVVFSEMKGRESKANEMLWFEAAHLLFPGKCGYKWKTGGLVHNLRTSTNNDKIQKYHRRFYRPDNMIITVLGNVDKKKLFDSIQSLEDEEMAKKREPFERPFAEPCPPLRGMVEKEVEYPDEGERFGKVDINWRISEDLRNDAYKYLALLMMNDYLVSGVNSPLQKSFVETTTPLASKVNMYVLSRYWKMAAYFHVPIDRLEEIKPAYFSLMRNVSTSDFDMERMRGILQTVLTERKQLLENNPGVLLWDDAIHSFIFEEDMKNLHITGGGKRRIEELLKEDESFWREAMKPFLNENAVVIVGRPSKKKAKQMAEKDEAFIKERIRRLGRDGLAEKAKVFEEAKKKNDALVIPREVLTAIPIPSAKSVVLPEVITARSRRLHPDAASQQPENAKDIAGLMDVLESPYALQISHFRSSFVTIQAGIHTSDLDDDLKRYLELYNTLIFQTSLKRGNETISHEDVELELTRETSGYYSNIDSVVGVFSISVTLEKRKFLKGLQYVKEGITRQIFSPERLRHYVTQLNNSLPSTMKSSLRVLDIVMMPMLVTNNTYERLLSLISQRELISSIADDLRNNEARDTLEKFKKITDFIANPKRVMLHIMGDVQFVAKTLEKSQRKDLAAVLDEYFGPFRQLGEPSSTSFCLAYRPFSDFHLPAKAGSSRVKVVGMSTEETAMLSMASVMGLSDDHPDLPILYVVISYLGLKEGPLFRKIRGKGLAYSFWFDYSVAKGYFTLIIFSATDVVQVYREIKDHVDSFSVENDEEFDASTLESAKGALIYRITAGSETPTHVARGRMSNCFLDRSLDHAKELIEDISDVTTAGFLRVMRERVQPLYDPKGNARIVITANPSKVDQIAGDFRQMGLPVKEIDVNEIR